MSILSFLLLQSTFFEKIHFSKISKVNVKTRQITSWTATDEDGSASEPIYVSNPVELNSEEDDGVILTILLTKTKLNWVSLVILNAKEMKEIGTVEFTTLGIVTGTSQGSWRQAGQNIFTFNFNSTFSLIYSHILRTY